MDYNSEFPLDDIREGDAVYIVDYHLPPEIMLELLKITSNVYWIDHHKTAIEKYKAFPEKIMGLRVDGTAACVLTYIYFNLATLEGSGKAFPVTKEMIEETPYFTRLIGDWDTWKFEYGEETKRFQTGMLMRDTTPKADVWQRLYEYNERYDDAHGTIVDEGRVALLFRDQWAKDYLDHIGFETEFEGHRCFAVNLAHCNSEYFKSIEDKGYDIYIPFSWNGEDWTVSLYTVKDIDVSEIAKKYGGGGHLSASGYVCKELPFSKGG